MSFITSVSRMWLTRSFTPFTFTGDSDDFLDYGELENLGLYVHIPFCRKICSFCPYCKQVMDEKLCDSYIDSLLKEIEKVGGQYSKSSDKNVNAPGSRKKKSEDSRICSEGFKVRSDRKKITSLYFGGGTPALASRRIKEIIDCIKKYFYITEGIGLELHPENVTVQTLTELRDAGVTKISIGIQSFNDKFLQILGRGRTDCSAMFDALKKVRFETVSMDFIFALPNQTVEDLKEDIEKAFSNGANHIAIYPFIDFSFAPSKVPAMSKKKKHKLLDEITDFCALHGYRRDSIWTFSNDADAKYSSMTRENFLGFGCSATTLLKDQFKVNTFSVKEYIKRLEEDRLPTALTTRFSLRKRMIYYLFWALYTTSLDPLDFEKFFGVKLEKMYGLEFALARAVGFMCKKNGKYQLTKKGCFYYHHYENFYTLSYIDRMWGLMKNEAFPDGMKL